MDALNDQVITTGGLATPIASLDAIWCSARQGKRTKRQEFADLTIDLFRTSKTEAVSWSPSPIAIASV